MALPDKHADELAVEIAPSLWEQYVAAKSAEAGWASLAQHYRRLIESQMGDAFAATVDGVKVATNRPGSSYAGARIRQDYPDLTAHYMTVKTEAVFDVDLFAHAHPEIAEKYRVRSFRRVEEK